VVDAEFFRGAPKTDNRFPHVRTFAQDDVDLCEHFFVAVEPARVGLRVVANVHAVERHRVRQPERARDREVAPAHHAEVRVQHARAGATAGFDGECEVVTKARSSQRTIPKLAPRGCVL
jgi:hypothetical protein